MNGNPDHLVILFDGVCNFCNASINFVIRRDHKKLFRFAPLQSEAGSRLLRSYGRPAESRETMLLIENNTVYARSTAALRIARRLSGPWAAGYVFMILPAAIRDGVYKWIARNRYRWFGKRDHCMVPTPDVRDRFLN